MELFLSPLIVFTCLAQIIDSLFRGIHFSISMMFVSFNINTTGVTSGAGLANPYGA